MAILAEWYTTHKSSDATYAILTALEDMGQKEAVKIIEESLEQAGSQTYWYGSIIIRYCLSKSIIDNVFYYLFYTILVQQHEQQQQQSSTVQ